MKSSWQGLAPRTCLSMQAVIVAGSPWAQPHLPTHAPLGSTPGWRTKIWQAKGHGQKKQKQDLYPVVLPGPCWLLVWFYFVSFFLCSLSTWETEAWRLGEGLLGFLGFLICCNVIQGWTLTGACKSRLPSIFVEYLVVLSETPSMRSWQW